MIISKHADERMTKRGIGKSNVLATILHGNKYFDTKKKTIKYQLEDLIVITGYDDSVITVYFDQIKEAF